MKTHTILVADDHPDTIQVIVDAIKNCGYEHKIIRAINGKILCELAEKRLPDLIITDWEMPVMDGIEAIKYLKSQESTQDIPIIMCTGIMTTSENLKMALDSGAVDFIRNPIDQIELQSRVHSMLKLSDAYRTIKSQKEILEEQKESIELQKDKLEVANLTKDKFFKIISHDLRNPFSTLMLISDLLTEHLKKQELTESINFAEIIHQTSYVAHELLENLLTWSKSQTGKIELNHERMKIKTLVDKSVVLLGNSATSKGIQITSTVQDDLYANIDKNMVLTILRNLISNAIKFSRKGDQINITGEETDDFISLHVSDTGIGIDEKRIKKLFRIDENVKTSGTEMEQGTGLGLILCKEFSELHKGNISVTSQLGVGSTFTVTLPKN